MRLDTKRKYQTNTADMIESLVQEKQETLAFYIAILTRSELGSLSS